MVLYNKQSAQYNSHFKVYKQQILLYSNKKMHSSEFVEGATITTIDGETIQIKALVDVRHVALIATIKAVTTSQTHDIFETNFWHTDKNDADIVFSLFTVKSIDGMLHNLCDFTVGDKVIIGAYLEEANNPVRGRAITKNSTGCQVIPPNTALHGRGSAVGFKTHELVLYAISILGKKATVVNVIKKVAELEGKLYSRSMKLKKPEIAQYVMGPGRLKLNELGMQIANNVSEKLSRIPKTAKAVPPLDLTRYLSQQEEVVTFSKCRVSVRSDAHIVNDDNYMLHEPSLRTSTSIRAGMRLCTVIEHNRIAGLQMLSRDTVYVTKRELSTFLLPTKVPTHIIKQAEERSVYLDALQEVGFEVPVQELKQLSIFLANVQPSDK